MNTHPRQPTTRKQVKHREAASAERERDSQSEDDGGRNEPPTRPSLLLPPRGRRGARGRTPTRTRTRTRQHPRCTVTSPLAPALQQRDCRTDDLTSKRRRAAVGTSRRYGPCLGLGLKLTRALVLALTLLLLGHRNNAAAASNSASFVVVAPLHPSQQALPCPSKSNPFVRQSSSWPAFKPPPLPATTTTALRRLRLLASYSLSSTNDNENNGISEQDLAHGAAASAAASMSTGTSISNPKDLLYQVQEQALVDRGVHEEAIMQRNVLPLRETVPSAPAANQGINKQKPKSAASRRSTGAGGGGGFGKGGGAAGGSVPSPLRRSARPRPRRRNVHVPPPKVDVSPYAQALQRDGVVRINSVLPPQAAREMREWVVNYRAEALGQVQNGEVAAKDRFADVLLRHNRCDMTLPLGPDPVVDALYSVLCQSSVLPEILRFAFRSDDDDDPVLYELSTLISDPGSQRQVVHPDNPILAGSPASAAAAAAGADDDDNVPVLLTCFVALQDVTEDMGPTVYLPGTHTSEAHRQFFSTNDGGKTKDELLESNPKVLGLLNQGDCSLYDSRVLHCGSANRHPNESRALFYMSFRNPRVPNPGNPASIRPGLAAQQLTLSQLQGLLVEHWTTGTTTATTIKTEMM